MYTIDFETEAITGNPVVDPPKPVGVSIKVGAEPSEYFPQDRMLAVLEHVWNSGADLLFHNAPFDISVAETHLGLKRPDWTRVHDTMYLVFFEDPYGALALKPCAERYLGLAPDAQDELIWWILNNVPGATKKTWGAHISKAPYEIVKPYAEMDTDMTYGLYQHLESWHDQDCYSRERELMYMFMDSTKRGLRVNRGLLAQHIPKLQAALGAAQAVLTTTLNVGPTVNLGSSVQLAAALDAAGLVDGWELTPTGKKSTKKDNLRKHINDVSLLNLMDYIGSLKTSLNTFLIPWYELSEETGRIFPEWNQIRSFEKGWSTGTRTGRPSCAKPNLLNVPTEYDIETPPDLEPLPFCRLYLLPEEGHVWCKRDFASQEVRIAAHFEDGALMQAYLDDPHFDPHEMAKGIIRANTGIDLVRKQVKIMAFRIIYGGGAPAVAGALGIPVDEGATLKGAYLDAVPGIRNLAQATSRRGYQNLPITTWGGRRYYRQEQGKEYKMMNYLIQGSAADQTKQCMLDWNRIKEPEDTFLAQVYDEIDISVPEDRVSQGMLLLKTAMEQDYFDVPMLTDGSIGPNWHELTEVN